jgi:hypothetical protein
MAIESRHVIATQLYLWKGSTMNAVLDSWKQEVQGADSILQQQLLLLIFILVFKSTTFSTTASKDSVSIPGSPFSRA